MKPISFLLKVWKYQAQKNCYFCLSTKSQSGGRWKDTFFQWPIKRSKLSAFLKKHPDTKYHVYFCPLPFRGPQRRREWVLGSQLLWADLDEANPQKFDPTPQIAWESSPGRFASLWILNEFHTSLEIEPVNKSLTYNVGADHGGWDLTQVLRIPGLRNLKYEEQPKAQLLWFTDNLYTIDDIPEMIEALDPLVVMKKYRTKLSKATRRLLTAKRATEGKRSDVIWRLENELAEQGLDRDEIFTLIKGSVWNKFRGRSDEDRQLRRELDKVEARRPDLVGKDDDNEDEYDEEPRPKGKKKKKHKSDGGLVRMSDVEPEDVEWLWWPYIPRGKLVMLEGDPGLGKSWLTLTLAMHVANKKRFPGTKKSIGGNVLLMSAEDGLGDTIRPRLDQVGANSKRIWASDIPISLDELGLAEIEDWLASKKFIMLVIDPLVAFIGGVDMHKANETREVMAALGKLAEKYGTTILCVRHLRKGGADKSIYRGMGSIDFTAAARSVLLVCKHPEEPDYRAVAHIKCNLAPLGATLQFELAPGKDSPFSWQGTTDLDADDLLRVTKTAGKSERTMAEEFLEKALEKGPRERESLYREGEARGVSKSMLIRMKKQMNIKVEKENGETFWSLDN